MSCRASFRFVNQWVFRHSLRKGSVAYQNGAKIDFSRPGKPTDNAFVESFNGTERNDGGQDARKAAIL
jgi:transposase InsO family protein